MLYEEWSRRWLNFYVKPTVKERTFSKYENILRLHVLPELGDKNLLDIDGTTLQKFVIVLTNKVNGKNGLKLSVNTINLILTVLKESLSQAEALGIIERNIMGKIQRPKGRARQIEVFTKQEQKKIQEYIFERKAYKLYGIALNFYLGLRIGELMALKWNDVDFQSKSLHVNKSCYDTYKDGAYIKVISTPKTENSVRTIPLPNVIVIKLKELKRQSTSEYVIAWKGNDISVRSYQSSFERLLRKLGLTHRGFHSIRHTFATRALESGVDVKTLSEILGHKNTAITLNRYTHCLLEHKKAMMNRIVKYC